MKCKANINNSAARAVDHCCSPLCESQWIQLFPLCTWDEQESVSTKTQNKMTHQQRISQRYLTKRKHRLNIRKHFLRLWCIKLWDHLPRGVVGTMKPSTYSTVKCPIGASVISAQGSCTESSTMPFPTLASKNQTQEVQRKKGKQWCQFAKAIQAFLHYCMS